MNEAFQCAADQTHCACFNIGLGQDGTPLLSWSQMKAVYKLPDGSIWAGADLLPRIKISITIDNAWHCEYDTKSMWHFGKYSSCFSKLAVWCFLFHRQCVQADALC